MMYAHLSSSGFRFVWLAEFMAAEIRRPEKAQLVEDYFEVFGGESISAVLGVE